MNVRTTLILAILAVAGGAVVLWLQHQGEPTPDQPALATRRVFPDVAVADVTRIEINRAAKGDRIVLEKVDGAWRLAEPVAGRADWHHAGSIATELASLAYGRKIALTATNVAEFGLQPPAADITFTAAGASHRIAVGNEAGLGNDRFTYVRLPDATSACLVKGTLPSLLAAETSEFRDKGLVAWGPSDVAAVALTRGDETIRAERADGHWILARPVRTRGDADALNDLAAAATGLKAIAFVTDTPDDPATYGIDAPRLAVVLEKKPEPKPADEEAATDDTTRPKPEPADAKTAEEPEKPEKPRAITITFGAHEDLQKTRVYAWVSTSPTIVTVEEDKVRAFEKDLLAFRDKHAVPITTAQVTDLAVDLGGAAVAVEKVEPGRWQIVAPRKAPAQADEVTSLLDRLADLKVRQFADGVDPVSPEYGFDKPYGTVTFRHSGDTRDTSVIIGAGREDGRIWVIESGARTAGRVRSADVTPLKTTWLDLHARNVWTVPDDHQVAEVAWTRRGETVRVVRRTRDGKPAFAMTSPVEEDLDADKAAKLFDAFRTVDAGTTLAPAAQAPDYALDTPAIRVTVVTRPAAGGDETARVLHVAEKNGSHVAMAQGGSLIFRLDDKLVEQLETPLSTDAWGAFEKDRAHRLEIAGPDITLGLNRSGDQWAPENPDDLAVDSMRVRWYVGDLADATASRVVAYAATDLTRYKLDTPEWRIRVKGLAVDKVFLIAADGPAGGRYATIEGSGRVVVLDNSQGSRLTKDMSSFRAAK